MPFVCGGVRSLQPASPAVTSCHENMCAVKCDVSRRQPVLELSWRTKSTKDQPMDVTDVLVFLGLLRRCSEPACAAAFTGVLQICNQTQSTGCGAKFGCNTCKCGCNTCKFGCNTCKSFAEYIFAGCRTTTVRHSIRASVARCNRGAGTVKDANQRTQRQQRETK
jgi:hypothetical protein